MSKPPIDPSRPLVRRAADAIGARLPKKSVVEFPPATVDAMEVYVDRYVDDLVRETTRVTERARALQAAPGHVQMAADRVDAGRRSDDMVGILGGIALGGAVSGYVSMFIAGAYPAFALVVVTILLVAGCSLLAFRAGQR